MDKLKNIWLNFLVLVDLVKEKPKTIGVVVVLVFATLFFAASRIQPAFDCYIEAEWSQSVPDDKWRFNIWMKECQYFNGTRWIPLKKVVDVGAGGDTSELEDMQ